MFILLVVGYWIRGTFFPKASGSVYWLSFVASIIGLRLGVYGGHIVASVVNKVAQAHKKRVLANTICCHGVKGGGYLRICEACVREQEEIKRRAALERETAERKAEILNNAKVLRRASSKDTEIFSSRIMGFFFLFIHRNSKLR
ncbi:MAG TPA: hypothetical protein VHD88_00130 [Pyrinomonadaceae bacterium]|nr:hypothetical protein [Pyrinomonadaceae bacterium]